MRTGLPAIDCVIWSSELSASKKKIKGLAEDKKDIFIEAKGEGFDMKILREVVRLRKQDEKERDERESLLDLYMHAIETGGKPMAQAA